MPSAWVAPVKQFYQATQKKDSSYQYSSAMKEARASYKKGGKAEASADEKAPKKRKRKAKGKASKASKPPRDVAEPAAPAKKKKKPKRKRPGVPKDFTNLN